MKIGKVSLSSDAVLAPLAGFTDAGFRYVAEKYGAGLTYTEMVSAKGLVYDSRKTAELLYTATQGPLCVQLFGSEPEIIAAAVKRPELDKFDVIDLNMGCPMPKIVKNGDGSALLKDPVRAAEVCAAAVENAGRPVTVKFRKGFAENENIAARFALVMQKAGASALAVHGRTREQYYSGQADYRAIAEAVSAVSIPVFANGDVRCRADYENIKRQTGAAGVMIGRGALGNPYIFSEIRGLPLPNRESADLECVKIQIEIMSRVNPERKVLNEIKKHVCRYIGSRQGAKAAKKKICLAADLSSLLETTENFYAQFEKSASQPEEKC